jgi:hypothetical protein
MAEADWLAEGFEQNRTRLRAVAYRMRRLLPRQTQGTERKVSTPGRR